MNVHSSHSAVLLQCAIAFAGLCVTAASAADGANSDWKIPRTADGRPDLQGFWTHETLTRFERPSEYGDRLVLTDEEVQAVEKFASDHVENAARPTDPSHGIEDLPTDCGYGFSGTNCGYNNFWVDRGSRVLRVRGEPRSSIIVEPANGRVPPLLPEARKDIAAQRAAFRNGAGPVDGPEIRSLGERCILSFGSNGGPPMLPNMYNNAYQIVQTPDHVMILVEMVHDARIIRLNDEPLTQDIPKWLGDSIGRWEGDTLVVETSSFHPLHTFRGTDENRKVIERFSRISAGEILYQFTVSDPDTLTQPFSGELVFNATKEPVYEYACHEGNYALPGILAGARAEEEREATGDL